MRITGRRDSDNVEDRRGMPVKGLAAGGGLVEGLTAWLLRRPGQGLLVGLVAVAGLTGVALVLGPPV